MNGGRAFFDTNVLLYMYGADSRKRECAIALFSEYTGSERLVISTHVVQEFYANGSRKLEMPRHVLSGVVSALLKLPVILVGPAEIVSAIKIEGRYEISFWDALIVAAADAGGAEVLFTEDLNHGQRYGAVMVRNPFTSTHSSQ